MILSFYRIKSPSRRVLVVIMELVVGILFVMFTYPILIKYFYNWLASDTNGLGRIELFSHIGDAFRKSPIIGLGPGTHSYWCSTMKEFHNSYLEILACSGIVGTIAFVLMSVRSFKRLLADPTFIPVMVSIYGYSLAGFAMRKLAYWGIFIFILIIAKQISMVDFSDEVDDEIL
jgi:O-antigen ligase